MKENEIGKIIVDAALTVHRELGPGLLELLSVRSPEDYSLRPKACRPMRRTAPRPDKYELRKEDGELHMKLSTLSAVERV